MAGGTVSVASSVSFTGKQYYPSVTVKVAGRTLTSGTDYTVSYSNNKNVGTSNVYVYGKGNYSGSLSAKFDIVPAKQQIQKLETKNTRASILTGRRKALQRDMTLSIL